MTVCFEYTLFVCQLQANVILRFLSFVFAQSSASINATVKYISHRAQRVMRPSANKGFPSEWNVAGLWRGAGSDPPCYVLLPLLWFRSVFLFHRERRRELLFCCESRPEGPTATWATGRRNVLT